MPYAGKHRKGVRQMEKDVAHKYHKNRWMKYALQEDIEKGKSDGKRCYTQVPQEYTESVCLARRHRKWISQMEKDATPKYHKD